MASEEDKKQDVQLAERERIINRLNATIGTPDKWVQYLSHLQFKEQFMLLSYFGINGFKQLSFDEAAKLINTSSNTARTYFNKACRKIGILQHEQGNLKYKHLFVYTNEVLTADNWVDLLYLSNRDKLDIVRANAINNAEEGMEILKTNPQAFTDNLRFFTENERYLVTHLFGLNGAGKLTAEQIIENLNISQGFFVSLRLSCIKKLTQIEYLLSEKGSTKDFVGRVYSVAVTEGNSLKKRKLMEHEKVFLSKIDYFSQRPEFINQNLTHLSIGEQYVLLRMLGLNGFERIPEEQIAKDLKILSSTLHPYLSSALRKLGILESAETENPELRMILRHKSPVLTTDNYTEYVGLSAADKYAVGVNRGKRGEPVDLEGEKERCARFRQIASDENAEFVNLFDQVCAGKDYKMPRLLSLVENNKKLTINQQNYMFSIYNVERLTGKDVANSCALAILIMGNQNIVNHIMNKKFATFNSHHREKIEMELQDALRRAIDNYSLECGTTFSTFAYKVLLNARAYDSKQIIPLSLDTTVVDDDGQIYLESALGYDDEFVSGYAENEIKQSVWELLGYLQPQNQFIVMAYYGKYREPMVLTEIGEVLGITKSRVSQKLAKSLELIRELMDDPKSRVLTKSPQLQDECKLLTEEEFNTVLSESVQYNR